MAALAAIPEEEIWLQKQKSARTRRAYRRDVAHFLRTLGIATPAVLRHKQYFPNIFGALFGVLLQVPDIARDATKMIH
jgi:hypothetical protein